MELIFKSAAVALLSTVTALLIKRTNPELSLMVGAVTASVILLATLGFASEINELIRLVKSIVGTSDTLIAPVLKCVAIALVTRYTAELCRDSAQGATAAAVETAGTMCAMSVAMPLIISMLRLIGGMV